MAYDETIVTVQIENAQAKPEPGGYSPSAGHGCGICWANDLHALLYLTPSSL